MPAMTPASEMLLRHVDSFTSRRIVFAGDIQDDFPAQIDCASVYLHSQQFHHWQRLSQQLGAGADYGLLADASRVAQADTLIYYWQKNKPESRFQLMHLLSLLAPGSELFIVGENRSGVRSATASIADYCQLQKIDSARRCGLYYGLLDQQSQFNLADYWHSYVYQGLPIKALPGVFSHNELDPGSELLISTFASDLQGEILDMGCGAGVLAVALAQLSPRLTLTLCDTHAAALASSEATLSACGVQGTVLASDVFSAIQGRFDAIIANPSFHEGRQTNTYMAQQLINQAASYLKPGGELRLVANHFLPYASLLEQAFGSFQILAQTTRFKVCQAKLANNRWR